MHQPSYLTSNVAIGGAEELKSTLCFDSQINVVNTDGTDPVVYWRNFIDERMSEY